MPAPVRRTEQMGMEGVLASCRELVARYLEPLPFFLDIRLADVRLTVRCNLKALFVALSRYYREFLDAAGVADLEIVVIETGASFPALPFAPKGAAGDAAKEECLDFSDGRVVRKRRSGLWLVFGPVGGYALGPCLENVDQVVNFIHARFMDRLVRAGARLLHAAGVAAGSNGLAIAGFAGAGKSTLALEIMVSTEGGCAAYYKYQLEL